MWERFCFVVVAPALLAGCATGLEDQPDFNSRIILPKAKDASGAVVYTPGQYTSRVIQNSPLTCDTFDSAPTPTLAQRNACITDLLTDIDSAYRQYEIAINNRISSANATFDGVALLAGTAAPATTGTAAKILSGITAVANGGKDILSQDVLYKETMQVLLSTMQADRAKEAASIRLSMQSSLAAYPMEQAKNDLLAYLYAGTLTNALATATQNASTVAQKCQAVAQAAKTAVQTGQAGAALAKVAQAGAGQNSATSTTTADQCNAIGDALTVAYNYTDAGKALDAFWKPDGTNFDQANENALKACMATTLASSTDADVKGIVANNDIATLVNTGLVSDADKIKILACAIAGSAAAAAK